MKLNHQIEAVDRKIEQVLAAIEESNVFDIRMKDIQNELEMLYERKEQLNLAVNSNLSDYDKLIKLPALIRKLFASKIDPDDLSREFASNKLNFDAVCKEIELLIYEQQIISKKQIELVNAKKDLDKLLKRKEELLEEFNFPSYRELSKLSLRIYSLERQMKTCSDLKDDLKRIVRDLDLVNVATDELIIVVRRFLNPSGSSGYQSMSPFTYSQKQKIKWMGRKLINIKVDLEKILSELEAYFPEPQYRDLQLKTNHFVKNYIGNMAQDIKNKFFDFEGVTQLIEDLQTNLLTYIDNIENKRETFKSSITELQKEKKILLIKL